MVMPLQEKGSLDHWLEENDKLGKLSLQEIAQFTRQAADALQYAHNRGVIHLDVKPVNFLVNITDNAQQPHLLLADFGIARYTYFHRFCIYNRFNCLNCFYYL